jgi:superfamily II DNA or RNA helicase
MQLRPYQVCAVEALAEGYKTYTSQLVVLATGCGKTVIFSHIAKQAVVHGGKVLVIAHRRELLAQAGATLARFGLRGALELAGERAAGAFARGECDVVLAGLQTLQGKRLAAWDPEAFSLIVVDEAHHTAAKSYRNILAQFPTARVLGVTATPDRLDGLGLGSVFQACAYRYDIRDGIKDGYLAPLELHSIRVGALDLSTIKTRAGDFAQDQLAAELVRDEVLHQMALPLSEQCGTRQTLCFCVGVEQSKRLAEILCGYGLAAESVDGAMKDDARAAVLARYRSGETQVVCNAMLLTEGFDAPETSCIALCRPTKSRALLTQMIGRGTRLAEGKIACLVLDFIPERTRGIKLSAPVDVLAGNLSEEARERTRELSENSADMEWLIAQAEQEETARELAAAELRRIERVSSQYVQNQVSVDDILGDERELDGEECDQWTRSYLVEKGFKIEGPLSAADARRLEAHLVQRKQLGLCTLKQARLLRKSGLPTNVSLPDASVLIDGLARYGWNPDAITKGKMLAWAKGRPVVVDEPIVPNVAFA